MSRIESCCVVLTHPMIKRSHLKRRLFAGEGGENASGLKSRLPSNGAQFFLAEDLVLTTLSKVLHSNQSPQKVPHIYIIAYLENVWPGHGDHSAASISLATILMPDLVYNLHVVRAAIHLCCRGSVVLSTSYPNQMLPTLLLCYANGTIMTTHNCDFSKLVGCVAQQDSLHHPGP